MLSPIFAQDELVAEYLELAKQSPPYSRGVTSVPCLRGHMFKCLFTAMAVRIDLRAKLTKARTLDEMVRLRSLRVCDASLEVDVKLENLERICFFKSCPRRDWF